MPVRPCWHQLKGKLFKAELLFTFWHVKSSSPLYAKASHNNHQTVTAMPQSAQIRRWLALKPSFKRGPKETQGAGFLPQVQSSTPHPPVLLLHQLGDNNRILNEGMRSSSGGAQTTQTHQSSTTPPQHFI